MTNERILLKYLIVLIYFNKNSYLVNNINISHKNLENIIKNIKNGKVKKHINKYSDANKLKILVIEAQKEKIKKYLNKVNIEFSKVAKTTGEITECCNIQYEGRDY